MRPTGIYTGQRWAQGMSNLADMSVMEFDVQTNGVIVEIIRMWVSPYISDDPTDKVFDLRLYKNDVVCGGSNFMTLRSMQGTDDIGSNISNLRLNGLTGASPIEMGSFAYHHQNGWLYEPEPDERPIVVGGSTNKFFGVRTGSQPGAGWTISFGVVWAEYSTF